MPIAVLSPAKSFIPALAGAGLANRLKAFGFSDDRKLTDAPFQEDRAEVIYILRALKLPQAIC